MPTELIGLEILPNVYISKITLHQTGVGSYFARAHVHVHDEYGDGFLPYWSDDKRIMDKMKLMFMSVDSQAQISAISRGAYDLSELMNLEAETGRVFTQYRKVNNCKKIIRNNTIYFKTIFEFNISPFSSNQAIFCCVMMKSKMSSVGEETIDKFMMNLKGPTTSEYILQNNKIAPDSHVFRKDDGTQWGGPVHYHPNRGYMGGAAHSEAPHPALTKTKIKNFKIINNIKFNFRPKVAIKSVRKAPSTQLWHFLKSDGTLVGMFGVNYKNIILRNTKYGFSLNNLDERDFQMLVNNLKIDNLSVIRHKVKTHKRAGKIRHSRIDESNRVINSFSDQDGEFQEAMIISKNVDRLVFPDLLESAPSNELSEEDEVFLEDLTQYPIKAELKEVKYNVNDGMKLYQFIDYEFANSELGEFKYEIKLDFKDPTIKFVENLFKEARSSLQAIEGLVAKIQTGGNYDYDLDMVKEDFLLQEENSFVSDIDMAPWVIAPKNHVKYLNFFYELTMEQSDFLLDTSFSKVHPKVATLKSMKQFVSEYRDIINKLYKHFDLSPKAITGGRSTNKPKSFKNDPVSHVITIPVMFNAIANTQDANLFYNFLSPTGDVGPITITKETLLQRTSQEKEVLGLPGNELYVSPVSIQKRNEITSVHMSANEEYIRSLNKIFENLISEEYTIVVEEQPAIQIEELEQENIYIPSSEILGDDSKFNTTDTENDLCFKAIGSDSSFSPNVVVSHLSEPDFSADISNLFQSSEEDLNLSRLRGENNVMILVYVKNLQTHKIEVLDGFQRDAHGNIMPNLPNWRNMSLSDLATTEGGYLCRLVPLMPAWANAVTNTSLYRATRLNNLTNKYFFVISSFADLNYEPVQLLSGQGKNDLPAVQSLSLNLDLVTTNIVTQNITIDAETQPGIIAPIPDIEESFDETINVIGSFGPDELEVDELTPTSSPNLVTSPQGAESLTPTTSPGTMGGLGLTSGNSGGSY